MQSRWASKLTGGTRGTRVAIGKAYWPIGVALVTSNAKRKRGKSSPG
jgi:hypothetical protein